jgi:hypothetical protein
MVSWSEKMYHTVTFSLINCSVLMLSSSKFWNCYVVSMSAWFKAEYQIFCRQFQSSWIFVRMLLQTQFCTVLVVCNSCTSSVWWEFPHSLWAVHQMSCVCIAGLLVAHRIFRCSKDLSHVFIIILGRYLATGTFRLTIFALYPLSSFHLNSANAGW